MTSPPPSPSFGLGGKYKLAEFRYGREEMLALFTHTPKVGKSVRLAAYSCLRSVALSKICCLS